MTHVINLLQPEECTYLSVAQTSPLVKIGAVAAVAVLVAGVGMYILSAQTKTAEGERIIERWEEIEDKVAVAKGRREKLQRTTESLETLQGWSEQRLQLPELLEELYSSIPEPREKAQFMRLHLETSYGDLQLNPEQRPYSHPAKSKTTIHLRGVVESQRPEAVLATYRDNLGNSNFGEFMEEVQLQDIRRLRGEDSLLTGQTLFNYLIELKPKEMTP